MHGSKSSYKGVKKGLCKGIGATLQSTDLSVRTFLKTMKHQSSKKYSIFNRLITNEHAIMAVLAAIVGLAGGFGAIGFRYLIRVFQTVSYGSDGNLLELARSTPWYFRILIPALGGLVEFFQA